jgi:hypothetical protein
VAVTVKAETPSEKTIAWFVKNVGPRSHYLPNSIAGHGWKFHAIKENKGKQWYLTLEDEKYLTYYLLVK